MAYDLAVAYRIYPQVAKPAQGLPLSHDKLRLAEACLRSFRESLGTLRVKIWALLDGCPPEYEDLFRRYFEATDLVLIPLNGAGNLATFGKQIDILLNQLDSDVVYFAEDDYLYLPNQFHAMIDFLRAHKDVDFISPYDHLDCYTLELHNRAKWLRVFADHHWRTASSTCLTFLTTRATLEQTAHVFRTYRQRNSDASLWLSLTKQSIWNPLKLVPTGTNLWQTKIRLKAWIHGWRQILFGSRRQLWVPLPGIATHLDANALSPTIDWRVLLEQRPAEDFANTLVSIPPRHS
jgi:hypothetical protein